MASIASSTETIHTAGSENAKEKNSDVKKMEQFEIDKIGEFLFELYHQQIINSRNDWLVDKRQLRDLFKKFQDRDGCKFTEIVHSPNQLGSLLYRSYFLINTPRGSPYYRIRCSSLYKYRNEKLEKYDELLKNGEFHKIKESGNKMPAVAATVQDNNSLIDPALQELQQVEEDSERHTLQYEGTLIQERKENFQLTSMGCFICQCNFSSMDAYEEHMEYHSDASDFKILEEMQKYNKQFLKLSYQMCKKSHYFCFTLEATVSDITIERIIIVQSHSMYHVHSKNTPYPIDRTNKDTFFADSHLFGIFQEQPIVVVFYNKNRPATRVIEQHHFMRITEFPQVEMCYKSSRLPNLKLFKQTFALPQYLPTPELRLAVACDDLHLENLKVLSNDFRNYIENNKIFTLQNMRNSLNILLQLEDLDTMKEYSELTQYKAELRKFGQEYSVKLKTARRIFIENVISQYDDVIIIADNDNIPKDLFFQNNDDIESESNKKKTKYIGQVESTSNGRVTFVCDKPIPLHKKYIIMFRPSRLTLRYQYRALERFNETPTAELKRLLFPEKISSIDMPFASLQLVNKSIAQNPEQLKAVQNIAMGPNKDAPYIIFGPPGTGKTTTVVEAILQLYIRRPDTQILVTSGSNSACDEIALRLCKELCKRNESHAITRIYSRCSEKRSDNIDELLLEHSNMWSTQFYPDIELLHSYRIVVCTLSVVGKLATGKFGNGDVYTHIFVDEAAASTEAETLVGLMGIISSKSRLILSGDHKQLGPILSSQRATNLGLGVSMMERFFARGCYSINTAGNYDTRIQTWLLRNYRSHAQIVQLYSGLFYNNMLQPYAGDAVTKLCKNWHLSPNGNYPIIFHSTFGTTEHQRNAVSLSNLRELQVVMDYVKDLMFFGVHGETITQSDIGIISPYKKQYLYIQEELNLRNWYEIECGSVEKFQGREKRIIIVSFVRSFTKTLGFLDNPRRLNVILSRPKSLLILIGNPKTLCRNHHLKYIIDKCHENKTLRGVKYEDIVNDLTKEAENNDNSTACNIDNKMTTLRNSMEQLDVNIKQQEIAKEIVSRRKRNKKKAANNNIANDNVKQTPKSIDKVAKTKKPLQSQRRNLENLKTALTADLKTPLKSNKRKKKNAMDLLFAELPSVPITKQLNESDSSLRVSTDHIASNHSNFAFPEHMPHSNVAGFSNTEQANFSQLPNKQTSHFTPTIQNYRDRLNTIRTSPLKKTTETNNSNMAGSSNIRQINYSEQPLNTASGITDPSMKTNNHKPQIRYDMDRLHMLRNVAAGSNTRQANFSELPNKQKSNFTPTMQNDRDRTLPLKTTTEKINSHVAAGSNIKQTNFSQQSLNTASRLTAPSMQTNNPMTHIQNDIDGLNILRNLNINERHFNYDASSSRLNTSRHNDIINIPIYTEEQTNVREMHAAAAGSRLTSSLKVKQSKKGSKSKCIIA